MTEVSAVRMYALRVVYLLNFAGGVFMFWPAVLNPATPLGLFDGFAFSFWAALTGLMGLGLRYPLQMLPLLILQLFYKSVWLLAVALPQWSAGHWESSATGSTRIFVAAVVIDLLVIPWAFVLANYVKKPGDRWTSASFKKANLESARAT
jgi:hypothetical protein